MQSNLVVALEWAITILAGRQLVGGRVDIAITQAEGWGGDANSKELHVPRHEHIDVQSKFCATCCMQFFVTDWILLSKGLILVRLWKIRGIRRNGRKD